MNRTRLIALSIVLLEAAIFSFTFGLWLTTVVLAVLAIAGAFGRIQFNPDREPRLALYLIIAVGFSLWWVLALQEKPDYTTILAADLSLAFAQYFLALQVAQFFLRHPNGMPVLFPFYGLVTLMMAGDLTLGNVLPGAKNALFGFYLLFALLCTVYFARTPAKDTRRIDTRGRRRLLIAAITMLSAVVLAWSTARFLEWAETNATQWVSSLINTMPEPGLGKDRVTRLGNLRGLKERQGRQIALRIYADAAPGYLRGNVYTSYDDSRWTSDAVPQTVSPVPQARAGITLPAGGALFPVRKAEDTALRSLEVWPEAKAKTALYTPPDTVWIGLAAEQLKVDQYGLAEAATPLAGRCYRAFAANARLRDDASPESRAACLALPEDLDPRIAALAAKICTGYSSPIEKIGAITQYFSQRYTYQLGIEVPPGEDPLTYFLFAEPPPPAHCEYFAAGAAILLRAAGVPCRYVTGVVSWEKHPYAEYWIARNRDAHAWAEAYGDAQGWMLVEATPAAGQPGENSLESGGGFGDAYDFLLFQLRRLTALLRAGQWKAGLWMALEVIKAAGLLLVTTVPGYLLLLLLGVLVLRRYVRRTRRPRHKVAAPSAELIAIGRLLRDMDRRVAKQHLRRLRQETIHAFARRVETAFLPAERAQAVAQWYRDYAERRYGEPITKDTAALLRVALERCWQPSPQTRKED